MSTANEQQSAPDQQEDKAPGAPPDLPKEDEAAEELTPEELRLMADTMPGEGPGGD